MLDAFISYKAKPARRDVGGEPVASKLPRPWVVELDDVSFAGDDDPENFDIGKPEALLLAAAEADAAAPAVPEISYVRYKLKSGKQSVGPADGSGRFPRPAPHRKRLWQLENSLGTIRVESHKETAFLLAIAHSVAPAAAPALPGAATNFICYKVKATSDVSAQTPESVPGSGIGRYDKSLEVFASDAFADCIFDSALDVSFAGSSVAGKCLFDLRKVEEICSPVHLTETEAPRETAAFDIDPAPATTVTALLCYDGRLAKRIDSSAAAALAEMVQGTTITPRQLGHERRRVRDGNPVQAAPGSNFPVPTLLESVKVEQVCLPTVVHSVDLLP